jgi:hypothetical protein
MRSIAAAMLVLLASACDSRPKEPPPDILKSHREQMDRAKDVGNVLERSNAARRDRDETK